MPEKTLTIVGLGEILWDVYDDEKRLGGAPANLALHVIQLGHRGIVVSRVGEDELGDEILSELEARGVAPGHIQRDPDHATGTVRVHLDAQGVPAFDCSVDVAFDYLEFSHGLGQLAASVDGIVFGTLAQRNQVARNSILQLLDRAARGFRLYDANFRGWDESTREIVARSLELADGVKINETEWDTLQAEFSLSGDTEEERAAALLQESGAHWMCVTLGGEGCRFFDRQGMLASPGLPLDPADTTGCGDAFGAALLVGLLQGQAPAVACATANALGALVATRKGAVPQYDAATLARFRDKLENAGP